MVRTGETPTKKRGILLEDGTEAPAKRICQENHTALLRRLQDVANDRGSHWDSIALSARHTDSQALPRAPCPLRARAVPASPHRTPGLWGRAGTEGQSRGDSEETHPTPRSAEPGQARPLLVRVPQQLRSFSVRKAHPEHRSLPSVCNRYLHPTALTSPLTPLLPALYRFRLWSRKLYVRQTREHRTETTILQEKPPQKWWLTSNIPAESGSAWEGKVGITFLSPKGHCLVDPVYIQDLPCAPEHHHVILLQSLGTLLCKGREFWLCIVFSCAMF